MISAIRNWLRKEREDRSRWPVIRHVQVQFSREQRCYVASGWLGTLQYSARGRSEELALLQLRQDMEARECRWPKGAFPQYGL